MAKAFAFTCLPFAIAEAATGAVSILTGELRIPPYAGVGTIADSVIFLAGLGVAILRAIKTGPSEPEATFEPKRR